MARIRTIKPDFFEDQKIGLLPIEARLLYIGLWVLADDVGNVPLSEVFLRMRLFPYNPEVNGELPLWVKELESYGMVVPYDVNEEHYGHLPKFRKHQRINRPSKHKYPPPPPEILEASSLPHDTFTETSSLPHAKLPKEREREKDSSSSSSSKEFQLETSSKKTVSRDASVDDVTTASPAVENSTSSWPKNLAEVVAALGELNAPEAFYDLAFWQRTHTAYAEDPDVFYVDELRNYLLWWHDQSVSRRRKAVTRSFGTWLRKTKTDAIRRKERRGGN